MRGLRSTSAGYGGVLSCDTSVQADATAEAVLDVLDELSAVRRELVGLAELEAAKEALTRGYVRHFETAGHLTRGLAQLKTLDLPEDTFSRFVSSVEAVTPDAIRDAACAHLDPARATVVVVCDRQVVQPSLARLGLPVIEATPEF